MELTVRRLREMLEEALEQLDDYDDSDIVDTSPNTYGVSVPYLATYQGFVPLEEIDVYHDDDDDDFDESIHRPFRYRDINRIVENKRNIRRLR